MGQLAVYATTPVLSRMYTPHETGVAGVFLAIGSIVGALSTWRFEAMLPGVPESQAGWVTGLGIRAAACTAVVTAAAYLLATHSEVVIALLLGAFVLGLGCSQVFAQVAARQQRLNGLAVSKGVQGTVQAASQIGVGAGGGTSIGLQLGIVAGYLSGSSVQAVSLHRSTPGLPGTTRAIPAKSDRRRLWRRAAALTIAAGLNLTTVWSPVLALSVLHTRSDVGEFSLAQRLAIAPAGLAVAALAPVIVGAAGVSIRTDGSVWPIARRFTLRLLPLGAASGLALLMVPMNLVTAVLGPDWAHVTHYLHALAPLVAGVVVVGPVSQLLAVAGHARKQLLWDSGRLAAVVAVTAASWVLEAPPQVLVGGICTTIFVSYGAYLILLARNGRTRPGSFAPMSPGEAVTP